MEMTTMELAYRRSGGIEVALFWNSETNELTVTVVDEATGDAFGVPAAPDEALDVFHHPYAHAALCGIEYRLEPLTVEQVAAAEASLEATPHWQGFDRG